MRSGCVAPHDAYAGVRNVTRGVGPVFDEGGINDAAPADDAPRLAWAKYYLRKGLKPVPKRIGKKCPAGRWKRFQSHFPDEQELEPLFDRIDSDGVSLVLDGTGWAVIDCDGPPDKCLDVLLKRGIKIPDACPTVITGRGHHHYYCKTTRPVGRHIGFIQDGDPKQGGVSIDLLGEGVVVAPPSRHPDTGERYRWQPPIHGANGPACRGGCSRYSIPRIRRPVRRSLALSAQVCASGR